MIVAALILSAASAAACPRTDSRADLLAIHEAARHAHLKGNAAALARAAADTVIFADGGTIRTQTRAEIEQFFRNYLQRVRYSEWKDAAPPVIAISPDGQAAWVAVAVEAKYTRADKPAEGEKGFKSSWIATYERQGCAWRMTGIASNVVE